MYYPNCTFPIVKGPDIHFIEAFPRFFDFERITFRIGLDVDHDTFVKIKIFTWITVNHDTRVFAGKVKFYQHPFGVIGIYRVIPLHGQITTQPLNSLPDEISDDTVYKLFHSLGRGHNAPIHEDLRHYYDWRK